LNYSCGKDNASSAGGLALSVHGYKFRRGGQANLFLSPQILKFLGSFPYRKSANFAGVPVRKSQNSQISTKYCTTLSQNVPKRSLFKTIFTMYKFELDHYRIAYAFADPQITKKTEPTNRKSAKCHICGRSANLTNYLSPQICGLAICGNFDSILFINRRKLYFISLKNPALLRGMLFLHFRYFSKQICSQLIFGRNFKNLKMLRISIRTKSLQTEVYSHENKIF
jgi:hypothetical protein